MQALNYFGCCEGLLLQRQESVFGAWRCFKYPLKVSGSCLSYYFSGARAEGLLKKTNPYFKRAFMYVSIYILSALFSCVKFYFRFASFRCSRVKLLII